MLDRHRFFFKNTILLFCQLRVTTRKNIFDRKNVIIRFLKISIISANIASRALNFRIRTKNIFTKSYVLLVIVSFTIQSEILSCWIFFLIHNMNLRVFKKMFLRIKIELLNLRFLIILVLLKICLILIWLKI